MIAPPVERPSLHGQMRRASRSSRHVQQSNGADGEAEEEQSERAADEDDLPVKRTSSGSNHSTSNKHRDRRKSSRTSSSSSSKARSRKTKSIDKTSGHSCNSGSEEDGNPKSPRTVRKLNSLLDTAATTEEGSSEEVKPSAKRSSRTSHRSSESHGRRSSRPRSSKGLRRMNSVDRTSSERKVSSLLDTAKTLSSSADDACEQQEEEPAAAVKRSSKSSERSDSQEKGSSSSRSRSSKQGLRRMNSIDNNGSGAVDSNKSSHQRPSLEKIAGSSRTMRRMTYSIERSDDETVQHAMKLMGSNDSTDDNNDNNNNNNTTNSGEVSSTKRSCSKSVRGSRRSTMTDLNNKQTSTADPLDVGATTTNKKKKSSSSSKSMHGRRSMSFDGEPGVERPRAKSTHRRSSSMMKPANIRESDRSTSAPEKSTRDSTSRSSRHQRSVGKDLASGGGDSGDKRSSRSSKSTHRRSTTSGHESRSRSHDKEESSGVKRRSRSKTSLREAVEKSGSDHRSSSHHAKIESVKEKRRSKSKTSLKRAVEESKETNRGTSDERPPPPPASKELSPKHQRSKALLRRSKSVNTNDEAVQRVRSRSTHRRSISVAMNSNAEEAAPAIARQRSFHRRSISLAKSQESPGQNAGGSLHRRSISLAKREEATNSRPGGSLHRRSILGGGPGGKEVGGGVVKMNERIPRSRRTSVDAAKQSLLDLHLNNRPRSKSPTTGLRNTADLRSRLVRSNSCDSRISAVEETATNGEPAVSKSDLLKPFPPLKRTSTGPANQRNQKGGIDRRQTIALLGAQDLLSKPEPEDVNKQRFADLGKKFQNSAMGIYKIAGKATDVKGKLGQLPSFTNGAASSLAGAMKGGLASSLGTTNPAATGISNRLGQFTSLDITATKRSSLSGAMITGKLPSLLPTVATTTPTAASIALQPIKTESTTTSEGIQSLMSLKELSQLSPIRTTKAAESNTDFSASFGTFSTATSSLSQSAHSSKTTGTSSTASLSLGSQSAHSRGSDGSQSFSSCSIDIMSTLSASASSLSQSVNSSKTSSTAVSSLSLGSRSAHSRRGSSSASNRSDPNAMKARAQRLKELSNAYRKAEEKEQEPVIPDFWDDSKEEKRPLHVF